MTARPITSGTATRRFVQPEGTVVRAALAVLDRDCVHARAVARNSGPVHAPTPGRPIWWDFMSIEMRDLAEAAIATGIWQAPE